MSERLRAAADRFVPPAISTVLGGAIGLVIAGRPMTGLVVGVIVGALFGALFYLMYQRPLHEARNSYRQLSVSYEKERGARDSLRRDHERLQEENRRLIDAKPRIGLVEIEYASDSAGVRHGLVKVHNVGGFGVFDGKYRIGGPSAAALTMANQDLQVAWKYDPRTNTDDGRSRLARGDFAAIRLARFEETETGWSVRLIAAYPEEIISPGGFFEARDGKGEPRVFEVDLWLFSEPDMAESGHLRLLVTRDSIAVVPTAGGT